MCSVFLLAPRALAAWPHLHLQQFLVFVKWRCVCTNSIRLERRAAAVQRARCCTKPGQQRRWRWLQLVRQEYLRGGAGWARPRGRIKCSPRRSGEQAGCTHSAQSGRSERTPIQQERHRTLIPLCSARTAAASFFALITQYSHTHHPVLFAHFVFVVDLDLD